MLVEQFMTVHLLHFLEEKMKTWSEFTLSSYVHQVKTPCSRKQQMQDQLAKMAVLLLVSSLCCVLHAQDIDDYITSETNVTTIDTKVVIGAPFAVLSKSMDVFTIGIPIGPVYIQAPSGLHVWLSIQCRGGAARLSVPAFVANFALIQTDHTGLWTQSPVSENASSEILVVTGLGIRLNQNVSVANDALATLAYGKGTSNDIAGKATMTITLNWNVTVPKNSNSFVFTRSRRIIIWAPTALTSISTFRATVAAVCLVGIFVICCLGCLNTVAISSLRRFSVSLARETRDQQECEQNRVFNPLWMPCAPSQPEYYNIESTPNPLMLEQRHSELKSKILRMTTPFSLMDRLTRVRHLKSSKYRCVRCRCPVAAASLLRDSSSDDELSVTRKAASQQQICCLSRPAAASRVKASPLLQMAQPARNSTMKRDSQPQATTIRNSTQPIPNYLQTAQPTRNSAMNRGSQAGPSNARYSTLAPPNFPLQRGAPHNWEQSQAEAMMNAQNYPATSTYRQQTGQQPVVSPGNQYRRSQDAELQGNLRNYDNITVGYAFVQYKYTKSVHADQQLATVGSEDSLRSKEQSAQPEHSKGKKLMRHRSPLEHRMRGCEGKIRNSILPTKTVASVTTLEMEEEIVVEGLESGSEM